MSFNKNKRGGKMIKINIEKPKSCKDCYFHKFSNAFNSLICLPLIAIGEEDLSRIKIIDFYKADLRPEWCPLKEVK